MSSTDHISILLIPYPTFNTLDLNGPLDVLGNIALQSTPFTLTIAAHSPLTTAAENLIVQRHISLSEASTRLCDFDVLIQPGGLPDVLLEHLKEGDETFSKELDLIRKFVKLGPSKRLGGEKRIIFSVCTGAFLLGYAGIFSGITATTHFLSLQKLQGLCDGYNQRNPGTLPAKVIPDEADGNFRYVKIQDVDPGTGDVRIISSGGISCGMDATLYLVELLKGRELAVEVARIMQYAWREM